MASEFWGTLSIYDHRQPYFRPSMLLFDRIVIPVPTRPWKGIEQAELDRLAADAEYLEKEGAAIACNWDPTAFDAWIHDELAVINAIKRDRQNPDRQVGTRYHVKWLVDQKLLDDVEIPEDVTAVPLFVSRERFASQDPEWVDENRASQATVDLILLEFPLARSDIALEDIIRLRQQGFVDHQLRKLRQWQMGLVEELLVLGDDPARWRARMNKAEADLRAALSDYRKAMSGLADVRRKSQITTLFAVLNPFTALSKIVEQHEHFLLNGQHERSWKDLSDKDFAFAGVICTADLFAG
ncbi:MAG TPA: hypothetical protein VFU17_13855 [Candidatus Limnocylindrales bacterium]|nr:hypothetical protein [Candidatus Limnocylindrales bacterium]